MANRDALAWLVERAVTGLPRDRARHESVGEPETRRLRAAIVQRAREHEPGVRIIENFRGEKFGVPLLLLFAGYAVGVWTYGEDGLSYREIAFKDAHRALDAIAIVTTTLSGWLVQPAPAGFPGVLLVEACENGGGYDFHARRSYDASDLFRERWTSDDGATTVAHVLRFLRRHERDAIRSVPPDVAAAREVVRRTIAARKPEAPIMNDVAIRRALRPWIVAHSVESPGAVIDELALGALELPGAVADVVLSTVNGLHAFEIKGSNDTFARLKRQGAVYEKIATTITLVVAPRHVSRAFAQAPRSWGLLVAEGDPRRPVLRVGRVPTINARRDPTAMLSLLEDAELANIASTYGIRSRRLLKWQLARVLAAHLSIDAVAYEVGLSHALRTRAGSRRAGWTTLPGMWPPRPNPADHASSRTHEL